jgi:hypothetical protein
MADMQEYAEAISARHSTRDAFDSYAEHGLPGRDDVKVQPVSLDTSSSSDDAAAQEGIWKLPPGLKLKSMKRMSTIRADDFRARVLGGLACGTDWTVPAESKATLDTILDVAYHAMRQAFDMHGSALPEGYLQSLMVQMLKILGALVDTRLRVVDATGKPLLVCSSGILKKPRKGKTDILIFRNQLSPQQHTAADGVPRLLIELKPSIRFRQQLHQMLAGIDACGTMVASNLDLGEFALPGVLLSPAHMVVAQKRYHRGASGDCVFRVCSSTGWRSNMYQIAGVLQRLCQELDRRPQGPGDDDDGDTGGHDSKDDRREEDDEEDRDGADDPANAALSYALALPSPKKLRSGTVHGRRKRRQKENVVPQDEVTAQQHQGYMRAQRQRRARIVQRRKRELQTALATSATEMGLLMEAVLAHHHHNGAVASP